MDAYLRRHTGNPDDAVVPRRMPAAVVRRTGGPDAVRVERTAVPTPDAGEVLIEVAAAAVNPVDAKARRGLVGATLPLVPGTDVAGVVVRSRSPRVAPGERVAGLAASGSHAAFATARADELVPVPDGLDDASAAAIPVSGLTAWQAVHDHGAVSRGQTVVVVGAAGGVGHLAVQFAKHAGAAVVGTGSTRNRRFVLDLGADDYVDYTRQALGRVVADADVVIDTVGGAATPTLVDVLHAGGVLVGIEYPAPADWPRTQARARQRGRRADLLVMRSDRSQLQRIVDLVARGDVRVEVEAVLPLDDVGRTHERLETRHTRGKLVLAMDGWSAAVGAARAPASRLVSTLPT